MIPSYGIMCKHILFTIGVSILLQVQTATCQIAESPEIKHTLHNVGDIGNLQIIGSTDSEFPSQIAVATNSPIDDSATETEVPILGENTNNAQPSTTATPEAVLAIRRVPSFDGLDSEALHLYSDLINALNETQKLAQEWKKFNASKAVLFIGKSGSGKTTLLQTIAGNISHLEAKELTEDSGDYYIDDGYKIHNGIESNSAVSADFITDNETGVVFVDNPGFHDAAGAARDLEIALNMKNLAESFKYVRIALVCPHSSLKKGSYRSEFTDFLERVIDFSNNSDNHFNKVSLIATKVKNSYTMKNKKRELVPDSAEMQAIANFIDEVKVSHSNQQSSFDSNNRNRSRLIVRIARSLIAKRSRKFKNIRVFRSPEEPGPLMNQSLMMDERKSIREMLLDEDGFEPVVAGSFGVAISATTRDSIDNLFRNLNRYIVRSTEKFGMFLKNKFSDKMKSVESEHDCKIENVIAKRINDLYLIQSLKKMIGRCSNPEEFVGGISDFIKSQNLTYNTSDLENIDTRYYILKNVENLTTKNYLLSENWENALDSVEKAIENEYLYQLMLQETFLRLREYTIEKRKLPSFNNESIALNPEFEISPQNVINDLGLARFASLEYNREKVEEFNRIVLKTFTRDEKFFRCNNNILVIFGKLVFISEVSDQLSSCSYVDTIVILAADTVVIDSDLNAEVLDGRNLMILAPHWVVQGKRSLVVSGKSQEGRQQKASQGMVGLDGKDGNSSGSFVGIGLYFRGIEDLTVEACGANGQDGQDGGDGKDGTDGRDEAFVQEGDEKLEHNFILYKMKKTVVIKEGQLGTAGQDSGAGGQGGKGGTKGSIKMIDLAHFGNPIQNLGHTSLECEGQPGLTGADGKPGNGGSNGCSSIIETRTHEVFVMKFDGGSEIKHPPCERFSTKGQVLRQRRPNPEIPIQRKGTLDGLVCRMFGRLRLYISDIKYYRSKLTMKLIDEFQKFMREKLCN